MVIDASRTPDPHQARPILPLVGILAPGPVPAEVDARLADLFGPAERLGGPWEFDCTRYYEAEMGPGLARTFRAFAPAPPGRLAAWKLATGRIEDLHRRDGRRGFNLDPGYLTLGGLFLASTKPASHRIYLAHGILGEVTLLYRDGGWQTLPWTFPDFRTGRYDAFLTECRETLKARLHGLRD
jgi:hypothetical protein